MAAQDAESMLPGYNPGINQDDDGTIMRNRRRMREGKDPRTYGKPAPAPTKADIASSASMTDLAAANQKYLDATATLEQRMQARVKLLSEELSKLSDAEITATERAKIETRIANIKTEMAGIQKDMDEKAKTAAEYVASAKERQLKDALSAEREIANEQKRAALDQRTADADRVRRLKDLASAAQSETEARYQGAQARAEEAFQGFMDPDRFRAAEAAKKEHADAEKELQDTVKWMGNRPRDWMSDKEKAAADVMSAREEAKAAAVVLGLIETNTRNYDKKLEQLLAMKG